MDYVLLGNTGVRVSKLCLGTMTFGNESDEKTSFAIMDRAAEIGINFFDTANIYNKGQNKGQSEVITGKWLKGRRESIVLASKVHFPTGDGPNERGSSRRNIVMSVEKSLDRLKTDWLDILYLHHWDADTDLEQTLDAVTPLVGQGKAMYLGLSNFSAWQTMKTLALARNAGFAPPVCIQPMYNLVKRQAEVELLPLAAWEGLAVFPYNPLAAGLLTGKYQRKEKGRLDENEMYKDRYKNTQYWEVAERFVKYAQDNGYSPAALAMAWVASHPNVTAPILGTRNIAQMNDTVKCLDIRLSPEQRTEVSALSFEPPLATDR
jgi:aryl-alcohol dehydrogenase-like predicted oxidoreductase